jgi:hypothetical protein
MKIQELKSLVKAVIREATTLQSEIVFGYDDAEPKSDSPVGPLNDISGKVANNIKTGQITTEKAWEYISKKFKSPNDIEHIKWRINKHLRNSARNESTEPSIGGSYGDQQTNVDAHNVRPERDPLTDPMLRTEAFRFRDFKWMSNAAGFGDPTDVFWDSVYLGTIESSPDGDHYRVVIIDTPKGKIKIAQNDQNKFKSKKLASESLYKIWKIIRKEGLFTT